MKPGSPLLHTTIACLLVGIAFSLLGGALGILGKWLVAFPLMALLGDFLALLGAIARVVATLAFGTWLWHVMATWFGWWRIACSVGTEGNRWASRAYVDGGSRWGVGVDVFGLQLDMYTVAGK